MEETVNTAALATKPPYPYENSSSLRPSEDVATRITMGTELKTFKYIYIPNDSNKEIEELEMQYTDENVVESLVFHLQKVRTRFFRRERA